jgi:hypothetical protein
MYFRWNNTWQAGLSVNERQQVRQHELGYVAMARAADAAKDQAMKELLDFSRGYPCPEPLEDGKCLLDFRHAPKPEKDWAIAKDFAINSTVKG